MKRSAVCGVLFAALSLLPASAQKKQWWMDEPVRWRRFVPAISGRARLIDGRPLIRNSLLGTRTGFLRSPRQIYSRHVPRLN